jgi:anion-transporting  ArsA/GET3 family ATPase
VSKVVGGAVLADAIAFFQAFDGMEAGFRERAERVLQLLSAPETAYTLVTAPRRESIEEAEFFAQRLADSNRAVAALIVNRMHPSFGLGDGATARAEADRWAGTPLGAMWANLADLRQVAGREEDELRGLAERVAPAPLVRVPVLRSDVHDLDGLAEVAGHIFGPPVAEGASGTGQ